MGRINSENILYHSVRKLE